MVEYEKRGFVSDINRCKEAKDITVFKGKLIVFHDTQRASPRTGCFCKHDLFFGTNWEFTRSGTFRTKDIALESCGSGECDLKAGFIACGGQRRTDSAHRKALRTEVHHHLREIEGGLQDAEARYTAVALRSVLANLH